MRIFILSDIHSTHTKRWVSSLSQCGCEIFLFGLLQCDASFYEKFPNVTIYNYNFSFHKKAFLSRWVLGKILYFKSLRIIKRKIAEFKPDILHAHYASSYGLLGALTHFHPYIISVWGSDVYSYPKAGWVYKKLLSHALKKADAILSTSQCMAKETQLYTTKKIQITPFGVDTEIFKGDERQERNPIVIGTVKTLSKNYGIDLLIKAFAIVCKNNPSKDLQLQIAGDGPDKEMLQNLCHELNVRDKVQFWGFVANQNLPQLYQNFDIFVALSHKESFGVVAIEAMACECPVVVSDAEGFCEVVVPEETGKIVKRDNPEMAAAAIQDLLDHPEKRKEMGKAGRAHVKKHYDWKQNVQTMISIYQQLH